MPINLPFDGNALGKLPIISWRGISFPLANLQTEFQQSIAQHAKPDRDGAKLEATGRGPINVSGTAIFYNGLIFDLSANTSAPLFPDVHREFTIACADRSTGDLLHPVLGTIEAKVSSFKSHIEAGRRDGAQVQVSWIEHTEDVSTLGVPSPLAFASLSADALDAELPKFPRVPSPTTSFKQLLQQIQGAADSVSLLEKRGAAVIPGILHQLDQTEKSLSSLATVTTHTARQLVSQLRSALYAVQATIFVSGKLAPYVVPIDTTLGALATVLKVPVTVLIQLNPSLVERPKVLRGTTVRYQP